MGVNSVTTEVLAFQKLGIKSSQVLLALTPFSCGLCQQLRAVAVVMCIEGLPKIRSKLLSLRVAPFLKLGGQYLNYIT